ncbi:hypothetical protein [Lactobacillus sp. ESL0225]|uniref:hypothetical protein n=1 Tax=Lactobacillus sp. ESL0225 TaxID=2069351 RepID=UPI000EFCD789|nr:hypothetical protein [Lactobacillus sp. ESL0225]RMC52041.1 hypothetical protein F5ESL0225_00800 [Lactobacillus sp. ESL0225]
MNNNHKLTYIVLVLIILLGSYIILLGSYIPYLFYSGSYIPYELDYQINTMIKNHDTKQMRAVSSDKRIYSFLVHLNKKDSCKNTSDYQGGSKNIYWYGTEIKGKAIGVDMKKENSIYWKVDKLYFTKK